MYIYVILEHLLGKYGHCNDYYGWMDSERMGITLRTKKNILCIGYMFPLSHNWWVPLRSRTHQERGNILPVHGITLLRSKISQESPFHEK